MKKESVKYVYLIMVFVAFIWGINPPVMKLGLAHIAPMPYNAARMLVALGAGWVALVISGTYQPFARKDIVKIFLVSAAGFFLFQIFLTIGVQKTTAGNTSLILAILPVSVAIINKVCNIEEISKPVLIGIIASLIGVVFIIAGSNKELSFSDNHIAGAIILLAAQASYGYYTVFSKELLAKYSTYQITAYVLLISTLLFCIIALPDMFKMEWGKVPIIGWASVIFSGLFPLCIGNFLWIWGLGKIGSTKAAIYNNLSPVFAVLAGYWLLGESFGLLQFIGAAIIFAGLYLTRTKGSLLADKVQKEGSN